MIDVWQIYLFLFHTPFTFCSEELKAAAWKCCHQDVIYHVCVHREVLHTAYIDVRVFLSHALNSVAGKRKEGSSEEGKMKVVIERDREKEWEEEK